MPARRGSNEDFYTAQAPSDTDNGSMLHFIFYTCAMVGTVLTFYTLRRRRTGGNGTYFRWFTGQTWTLIFLVVAVVGFGGLIAGK